MDALVLADSDLAEVRIAGLAVRERAVRIARRLGADRVLVVSSAAARNDLGTWRDDHSSPLLVIRADQLVHTPLVAPLVTELSNADDLAIAVGADGAYAGAFTASGRAATDVIAALARGESDVEIALRADRRVPHGDIARHPIATRADRAAAHRMLYRILTKPQDNALARYVYRPVSSRISRLLLQTPITAMHVSSLVAILVAIGCWLTTYASTNKMIAGALIIVVAAYFDCCDGEIARVKLQASRAGAWMDTIVDELSSIGYMLAIGWHCHLMFGRNYLGDLGFDPWLVGIAIGAVTYLFTLYGVYYNIIVAVGSANSQDYIGRFRAVPGERPNSVRLVAELATSAREWPRWIQPIVTFLPNVVRRDFIVWLAAGLAVAQLPQVSFGVHVLGGVVSSIVIALDHIHLRGMRSSIARAGQVLEVPRK